MGAQCSSPGHQVVQGGRGRDEMSGLNCSTSAQGGQGQGRTKMVDGSSGRQPGRAYYGHNVDCSFSSSDERLCFELARYRLDWVDWEWLCKIRDVEILLLPLLTRQRPDQ